MFSNSIRVHFQLQWSNKQHVHARESDVRIQEARLILLSITIVNNILMIIRDLCLCLNLSIASATLTCNHGKVAWRPTSRVFKIWSRQDIRRRFECCYCMMIIVFSSSHMVRGCAVTNYIAAGTFGSVYQARNTITGTELAWVWFNTDDNTLLMLCRRRCGY